MIPLRLYRSLLSRYLRPLWAKVLVLGLLLLAGIALKVANPLAIRHFIDLAQTGGSLQALTMAGLLFLAVGLVVELLSVLASYVGGDLGYRATDRLRADLLHHTLSLDLSFHHRHTPGEMIERLDGDVARLNDFFSQFTLLILGNALLLIGILAMFYREDWRMGAAFTVFCLISILLYSLLRERSTPHWKAQRRAQAQLSSYLEERLDGIDDLRANAAPNYVVGGLCRLARRDYRRGFTAHKVHGIVNFTTLIPNNLAAVIVLGVGAYLFMAGEMTIGTVYLCYHYCTMLLIPLQIFQHQIGALQQVAGSLQRIDELLQATSALDQDRGKPVPTGAPQVEFAHTSFHYGSGEPVLDDFSLVLPAGRSLGLVGHTGSGKTTLTRLLFRFYDPTAGHIALDGQALRDFRLADLRRHIGLITQDVQFIRASLRDNLTFFDASVADKRILTAVESLGLEPWLAALPQGLDSELTPTALSAGQAQLLALTRVFLKDPGLVVLDEASARLDPLTQTLIETALTRLLTGRTSIVIAHRLHTLQRVDDIAVLDKGALLEYGRRRDLAQNPDSHLSRLLRNGLEGQ
ncbi:MAG: ATP-binding cassette domain-containing protein [Candidatus Latescibacteria bacterium]|nr:ATP-binding cassette domain-containing protein [Candidatus Latescibacterota bacterium]